MQLLGAQTEQSCQSQLQKAGHHTITHTSGSGHSCCTPCVAAICPAGEEDVGRHEVLQEVSRGKKCDGYHQVEEGVKESAVVMVGVMENVVAMVLERSLK